MENFLEYTFAKKESIKAVNIRLDISFGRKVISIVVILLPNESSNS